MPRPRTLRNGAPFLLGSVGLSGDAGSPAEAPASVMAVRYPNAIDTPPTITDAVTPLAGQWHNYLALMIEAVMGEIGPLGAANGGRIGASENLLQFLGTEGAARLSLVRSIAKDEAGQVYGVVKKTVAGTMTALNNETSFGVNNYHGADPSRHTPLLFGCANRLAGVTPAEMAAGPAVVRGRMLEPTTATNISGTYRGATALEDNGHPSGSKNVVVDLAVFFMPYL